MGYLDKSKQTVTAHFTKRGRELLADALSGNESGDYIITKWALGDDEVDYDLYDESLSSNLRGKAIENMPMMETPVNEHEVMNTFIVDAPAIALQAQLANIPDQIILTGKDDIIDISPITDNYEGTETYEFVLSHDNVAYMYDINNPPAADFIFSVDYEGAPEVGSPPIANFNHQVVTPTTNIPPGWNAGSGPPPGVI